MSDSRFLILDRIKESNPTCGPGNMEVCRHCVRQSDLEHQLANEIEKMCLPTSLNGNVDEWQTVKDLLRMRRGQRGQMNCMEGE